MTAFIRGGWWEHKRWRKMKGRRRERRCSPYSLTNRLLCRLHTLVLCFGGRHDGGEQGGLRAKKTEKTKVVSQMPFSLRPWRALVIALYRPGVLSLFSSAGKTLEDEGVSAGRMGIQMQLVLGPPLGAALPTRDENSLWGKAAGNVFSPLIDPSKHTSSSFLARVATAISLWVIGSQCLNSTLAHYTGYKVSQLKDCVMEIYNVQMNRKASTLVAIREKYQQHMFKCVASLPPPPFIAERFFEDTPN